MPKTRGRPITQRRMPNKKERARAKAQRPSRRLAKERAQARKKKENIFEFILRGLPKFERRRLEWLRGVIPLTPEEKQIVARTLKEGEIVERGKWDNREGKPTDARSLANVSAQVNVNIERLVENLGSRFAGKEIVVLFEGNGFSTAPEELQRACAKNGIKARVIKTDIYPKKRYREIARTFNEQDTIKKRGVRITDKGYLQATPEMLVELLGKKSVHLVVSCLGGMMYSKIPFEKGLSNIMQVLAHGGEAVITSHKSEKNGGRQITKTEYETNEFFVANPKYHVSEDTYPSNQQGHWFNISNLRIRKGIPFKKGEKIFEQA